MQLTIQERIAARLRAQIAEATAQLEHADALIRDIATRNVAEFTRLLARQEAATA